MSAELLQLEADLQALGLTAMAQHVATVAEQAARDNLSYVDFLQELTGRELEQRRQRWLQTKLRLAGLPFRKTLAEFDFSFQPGIDERLIRELATLAFVRRHENVILLGSPGVGKTHLAVALALEALHNRVDVYYTTAHALVADLRGAHLRGTLPRRLGVYTKAGLLVIDELSHATFGAEDAHHFFRLVSERYERGSMILIANRSYGEWGELFGDRVLAAAILDRILHHSVTVQIRGGKSFRLKDQFRAGTFAAEASGLPSGT
jgi:DNA replication protein DnaC